MPDFYRKLFDLGKAIWDTPIELPWDRLTRFIGRCIVTLFSIVILVIHVGVIYFILTICLSLSIYLPKADASQQDVAIEISPTPRPTEVPHYHEGILEAPSFDKAYKQVRKLSECSDGNARILGIWEQETGKNFNWKCVSFTYE